MIPAFPELESQNPALGAGAAARIGGSGGSHWARTILILRSSIFFIGDRQSEVKKIVFASEAAMTLKQLKITTTI